MFVALAALAWATSAIAQVAPRPDPARTPELAKLHTWINANTREARACSGNVRLSVTARTFLDRTKSEQKTAEALEKPIRDASRGRANPERIRALAVGYARTATVFSPLAPNAAGIAIAELCRSAVERRDRPFADEALLKALVDKAGPCGAPFASAGPDALECVVKIMQAR